MRGLLLPTTDAGVAIQVAVLVGLTGVLVWRLRADRDVARLVVGLGLLTMGAVALRALH